MSNANGLDLTTYQPDVHLTYWIYYDTEPSYDFFLRYYSNDGSTWTLGDPQHDGNSGGWEQDTVSIVPAGFTSYYVAFVMKSDETINVGYEGVYIDDIVMTGTSVVQAADLELANLVVSPSTVMESADTQFTYCEFDIINHGPSALSSDNISVDYYLSTDATFGDADDVKMGDTGFNITVGSGGKRWLRKFGQVVKVDLRLLQEDQIHGETT
ncbi:hypothetical protein GF420_02400 [candidate division GN15 bacterium]|nr:hypothetical protein [candidate division GN15 bacterium]